MRHRTLDYHSKTQITFQNDFHYQAIHVPLSFGEVRARGIRRKSNARYHSPALNISAPPSAVTFIDQLHFT